jgi:hypothetical protein
VAINQRFADAVIEEASSEDPLVLVHDYHFALVPGMVRERLPSATILRCLLNVRFLCFGSVGKMCALTRTARSVKGRNPPHGVSA